MGSLKRGYDAIEKSEKLPVLDRGAWLDRMKLARKRTNPKDPPMLAFYSSLTNAITTDLEMMYVPLDDHAFCRGHALFDTATLASGRVYPLTIHLDRLFKGAKDARIPLPFPGDEAANRQRIAGIIADCCVASGQKDAMIRYWLSAGTGNFAFSNKGCETTFYCVIFPSISLPGQGHKEVTIRESHVPMKPPMLAEMKSNNYLLNCLTAMKAQDQGGFFGIMVKPDGYIAEGCGVNCIFITKDRKFITPPFSGILSGTTVRRMMQLAEKVLVKEKGLLCEVRQEEISEEDARQAVEIIMSGGDTLVMPIIEWDGKKVGTGEVGEIAKELKSMLDDDARHGDHDFFELNYDPACDCTIKRR